MSEMLLQDLPQLIVALDSNDETANYVHIKDIKDNVTYYCPCCKSVIKPRAYKNDREYKVQPHFYHENGGCNEETYIHYICKNWLFESGCMFIINNVEYVVNNIEVEKTINTSFGIYKPDIIVNTTSGKTFYFEIKSTNKKTDLYAPKWDELGNDVVEVDVRYFINQKCSSSIPEFKLIYSDGNCFIKSYTRNDYDNIIAKRKLEWKRQDKINYKIQWERLDWFWIYLNEYLISVDKETKFDELLAAFKELEFNDMDFCMNIIKKHKLNRNLDDAYNMIEDSFNKELDKRNIIYVNEISPQKRVFRLLVQETDNIKIFEDVILKHNFNKLNIDIISELELMREHCIISNADKINDEYEKHKPYAEKDIIIKASINCLSYNNMLVYGGYGCYIEYIDVNNNNSYKSHEELKAYRKLDVLKESFSSYLDNIKSKINECKNKAWYSDYNYLCIHNEPYIKFTISYNKRNSCDIQICISKIDIKDVENNIKDLIVPYMNRLIDKDGYIKTKYNYNYGKHIYCENNRLIMINNQEEK